MRVLSFETSKRLTPYLDKEKIYENYWDSGARQDLKNEFWFWITSDWEYPALNLEEALEILPPIIWNRWLEINKYPHGYCISYSENYFDIDCFNFSWKTLIEAVNKMINHLLDNNLIKIWEQ